MLSTEPAVALLERALATNSQLQCTILANSEGVLLLAAGQCPNAKLYALLAASAYNKQKGPTGLQLDDSRVWITAIDEYLFVVIGPKTLPWGVFVATDV